MEAAVQKFVEKPELCNEAASAKGSPYRKMLSSLWRESPLPLLEDGQQLATMASLLHVDSAGQPMASALIERSGLKPAEWLGRYFEAYLVPLVHCLYQYELAFMPHGENVILVLHEGVVERAVFKDIAEEIAVMSPDADLPEAVARVKVDVPQDMKLLSIFTDVFDCFLRFLGARLAPVLGEAAFWRTVAECTAAYLERVPHLAGRYDIFADEFALSCLNRLQLRNNRQMVDIADPSAALQLVGTLRNPIAPYAP